MFGAVNDEAVSPRSVGAWIDEHRTHLRGVAYRMLGSYADAEDVLQDAYLKASRARPEGVVEPRAYLRTLVTRLCLDHLKSARVKRQTYVGPWLPEPLLDASLVLDAPPSPGQQLSLAEDVSLALLVALERLSPVERAAFLLHDVFDTPYAEIASLLEKDEAACRQLVSRARKQVRSDRPRYSASKEQSAALLDAFQRALASGDASSLEAFLTEDVTFTSDGGGKVSSATKVLVGPHNVSRFVFGLAQKFTTSSLLRAEPAVINGGPGVVFFEGDAVSQALCFELEGHKVKSFFAVRNPDKLQHLVRS